MITRFYADVLPNGDVQRVACVDDPDDGPPQLPNCEGTCQYIGTTFTWDAPSATHKPTWPSDATAIVWVETAALSDLIAAAVAKCYPDIDAVYADAVGNRTEEYKDAESDARAFKAAGYTGIVSDYVHDFALHNPTGTAQTDQWAADQIIARADAFNSAKLSMRSQRFASQAAMRAAATADDLNTAVSAWNNFIATTRQNLSLPPAP